MDYPETRRENIIEDHFGVAVADPYRWLEDADSAETRDWVERQRAVTEQYLAAMPERAWFRATAKAVIDRERAGSVYRMGGRYFVSRNDGTQAQDVWHMADSLNELVAGGRVVLDPNTWSSDGKSSLHQMFTVSDDGTYLLYARSDAGSDWVRLIVLNLETGEEIDDGVVTKFTDHKWMPDGQSYIYQRRRDVARAEGTATSELTPADTVIHRIGTSSDEDVMLWHNAEADPQIHAFAKCSHDKQWMILMQSWGTERGNSVSLFPLTTQNGRTSVGDEIVVVPTMEDIMWVIATEGNDVIIHTDKDAPNGRVVRAAITANPEFVDVVPTSVHTLADVAPVGEYLAVVTLEDVSPRLHIWTLSGVDRGELPVGEGAPVGSWSDESSPEGFFAISSVTTPTKVLRFDAEKMRIEEIKLVGGTSAFTPPTVRVQRRRAVSKDGVKVPYWLITADFVPEGEGPKPTLVYGYGGFNVPVFANYGIGWVTWLAAGGQLAICNLRGGGEFGREWYDGGRRNNKQHVFDDVIAVGEDLCAAGLSSPEHLTVHGRSNGGLLAGAAMTQRPDLWKVALPMVGVLDMLRFHKFTGGKAWISDYGDPDVEEDFRVAYAYSPLHNVKSGVKYPATLIPTGDHDDRVVPLHSHKFTATLQHHQAGDAPILTRIEVATGHGAGKPMSMLAEEWADILAFAAHHTGLVPPQK